MSVSSQESNVKGLSQANAHKIHSFGDYSMTKSYQGSSVSHSLKTFPFLLVPQPHSGHTPIQFRTLCPSTQRSP